MQAKNPPMLSIEAIHALAVRHGLDFSARYPAATASDQTAPKPQALSLWFKQECVEAWTTLMTHLTEVPVSVGGTRMSTGSGATDGRLMSGYAAQLDEVNRVRAALGLERIYR